MNRDFYLSLLQNNLLQKGRDCTSARGKMINTTALLMNESLSSYKNNHWWYRALQPVHCRILAICNSHSSISWHSSFLKGPCHLPPEYDWCLEWDSMWTGYETDPDRYTQNILSVLILVYTHAHDVSRWGHFSLNKSNVPLFASRIFEVMSKRWAWLFFTPKVRIFGYLD